MPIRQPLQTPDSAEDSITKSSRFMVTPDPIAEKSDSNELSLTTPLDKPVLTVSHSELTFAKTAPGHPKYLVLTISQQNTNTPVTLTTDAPDHFQLASDSHPNFAPSLTLVPSAKGTYVHVRYVAKSLGTHQGQLFIEAPYDKGTLPLKGSSSGILPAIGSSDNRRAKVSSAGGITGTLLAGLLVGVGGLTLGGYYFRCTLFPSLCSENVTNQRVLDNDRPQASQTSSDNGLVAVPAQPTEEKKTEKRLAVPARKKSIVVDEQTNRTSLPNPVDNQRTATPTDGIANKSERIRTEPKQETSQRSTVRPQKPPVTTPAEEESELEQELNQKPPRQQNK